MPVVMGTHRNGARFAKVWLSDAGISATVEGTGRDDDAATEDLAYKMRKLCQMAEEAADSMKVE